MNSALPASGLLEWSTGGRIYGNKAYFLELVFFFYAFLDVSDLSPEMFLINTIHFLPRRAFRKVLYEIQNGNTAYDSKERGELVFDWINNKQIYGKN